MVLQGDGLACVPVTSKQAEYCFLAVVFEKELVPHEEVASLHWSFHCIVIWSTVDVCWVLSRMNDCFSEMIFLEGRWLFPVPWNDCRLCVPPARWEPTWRPPSVPSGWCAARAISASSSPRDWIWCPTGRRSEDSTCFTTMVWRGSRKRSNSPSVSSFCPSSSLMWVEGTD